MLSLLTPQQSEKVGGPIGSLREAKTVASYPNYDAAYLAKRLPARKTFSSPIWVACFRCSCP